MSTPAFTWVLILLCGPRKGEALDSAEDGITALRGAALFEGLMAGIGSRISPHALPRAVGPGRQRCGLQFGGLFRDIEAGLAAFEEIVSVSHRPSGGIEHRHAVVASIHQLGHSLRGFASACHRCRVLAAERISGIAATVLAVDIGDVSYRDDGSELTIQGVDIKELLSAGVALRGERYQYCGLVLVLAIRYHGATGDNDGDVAWEALHKRDSWATTDAAGRVRGESELREHLRERWYSRRQQMHDVAAALSSAPVRPLASAPTERGLVSADAGESLCCCCWALETDRQEREARVAHVL